MLPSLKTAKASGKDGISAHMLKYTADAIAPSITKLFNLSIQLGQPPTAWKCSNVVPIPKKQGAKGPNDFRPISLLPILSKILEKHFHCLISDHLREHCPLSNCQWGFQAAKSSVSALLSTTHDWFQQIEDGKEIGAVFFAKPLTLSLISHYLLSFVNMELTLTLSSGYIHNYLADRKQCVVVNGASSLPTSVVSGVPQGSILGPLLFLIYIDDIADVSLSDGSKIVLYADDILLYCPITLPVEA